MSFIEISMKQELKNQKRRYLEKTEQSLFFSGFGSRGSQILKKQLPRSLFGITTLSGKGVSVGETGGVPHDMHKGFWQNLSKPIIGLAPMDGVTDAAFRFITAKYGHPHFQITEFTSVEGICAGATRALDAFIYNEEERPIVAQLFGNTPECFYKATFVVCELGFDGVDINMGCPAKNVASKGAGAALIQTPELAKKIIHSVQQAAKDWANGKTVEEAEIPSTIMEHIKFLNNKNFPSRKITRKVLPVSVKTRIGYDHSIVEEWIKHILETKPVNISLHGRTLKQMYSGNADWEAIGRAATIIHQTQTTILGNGDIKSLNEAHQKILDYSVDGVLIGRATFGNPWFFQNHEAKIEERLNIAIEHAEIHEKAFGKRLFMPMRKHLAWYCKGFSGASEVRQKLMQTTSAEEVKKILNGLDLQEPLL